MAKLIRSMLFKQHPHKHNIDLEKNEECQKLHSIKFSLREKFVIFKTFFYNLCKKDPNYTDNEKLFIRGEHRVFDELNLLHLVKTVQKLKSAVNVLIEDHFEVRDIIPKIAHNYLKYAKIASKDIEDLSTLRSLKDDTFMQYMQRDERFNLNTMMAVQQNLKNLMKNNAKTFDIEQTTQKAELNINFNKLL